MLLPLLGTVLPSDSRGVWYTIIGDGIEMTASTSSQFTNFETVLNIFIGDDNCSKSTCVDTIVEAMTDCVYDRLHSPLGYSCQCYLLYFCCRYKCPIRWYICSVFIQE